MEDIFSILNIDRFAWQRISSQGSMVYDNNMQSVLDRNLRRLHSIAKEQYDFAGGKDNQAEIDEVIEKLKDCAKKRLRIANIWTTSEIRILSYNINKFADDDYLMKLSLGIVENVWRNTCANGLVYSLLSYWHTLNSLAKSEILKLLSKKIKGYDGKSRRMLFLADHLNLFDNNGPIRMAKLILAKEASIFEAPSILGYLPSAINMEYFSDVIIEYYTGERSINFQELDEVFKAHTFVRTKKLVAVNMVEYADEAHDESIQNNVSQYLNEALGSITLPETWAPFSKASTSDKQRLEKARELVKKWLAQKVIEVFFEVVCQNEPDRKNYWLKWVPMIKEFRIVGSDTVEFMLRRDNRLKNLYKSFFTPMQSYYETTAALVLFIKDRVFIEFSEKGNALYIYQKDDPTLKANYYGKRYVSSISSLKKPNWHMAAKVMNGYTYFQEDGKLNHSQNWQQRLDVYMARKASINLVESAKASLENRYSYTVASEWFAMGHCRIVKDGQTFKLQLIKNSGEVGNYILHTYRSSIQQFGKIVMSNASYGEFLVEYVLPDKTKYFIGYIRVMTDRVRYTRKTSESPRNFYF